MTGPHKPGDSIGGRYNVMGFIGQGGMQYVYRAHDVVLGRMVALKTPKNPSAEKRFERSAIVSARVNHPNVAKTLDYFETDSAPYLIEEYIDGQDLDQALLQKVEYVDPFLAAKLFHYLARGLAASHHAGVVHRDLKPTNVMVVEDFQLSEIKITDFGIAKMADEELVEAALGGQNSITNSQTAVGALPYMAPEAISDPRNVSFPADIWSVGAMTFELVTGKRPFGSGLMAVNKILSGQVTPEPEFLRSKIQFQPLASSLMGLVSRCLQLDPAARPTADELISECGTLCYPLSRRQFGIVRLIRYDAWGFIDVDAAEDVFFHFDSVYGNPVSVGDRVMLSRFSGGGADRAHPVVALGRRPKILPR